MTGEKIVIGMISIFVYLSCSETNNLKTKQFFNTTENELNVWPSVCVFVCFYFWVGSGGGGWLH